MAAVCSRCHRQPVGDTPGQRLLGWCSDCTAKHQDAREHKRRRAIRNRMRRA